MRLNKLKISLATTIICIHLLGSLFGIQVLADVKKSDVDTNNVYVLGPPPGTYRIISENKKATIPFEFYRNKFRFKAQINGIDCHMMLDNGSLWDEILFFGSPNVDSIGFHFTEETAIGLTKSDVDTNISIHMDDIVFEH